MLAFSLEKENMEGDGGDPASQEKCFPTLWLQFFSRNQSRSGEGNQAIFYERPWIKNWKVVCLSLSEKKPVKNRMRHLHRIVLCSLLALLAWWHCPIWGAIKRKRDKKGISSSIFQWLFSSDVVELTCGTLHNSDKVSDKNFLGEQVGKAIVEMSK